MDLEPRLTGTLLGTALGDALGVPAEGMSAGLAAARRGEPPRPVGYSALAAMARNLLLYPVIIAHGLRRLVPL